MIHPRNLRLAWQLTAIVVIFQLSVVQAMASSGAFHKHLHDHADEPGHECAATLMIQGGYDVVVPATVPVDFVAQLPDVPVLAPKPNHVGPSHLIGGILAHAPPRGP